MITVTLPKGPHHSYVHLSREARNRSTLTSGSPQVHHWMLPRFRWTGRLLSLNAHRYARLYIHTLVDDNRSVIGIILRSHHDHVFISFGRSPDSLKKTSPPLAICWLAYVFDKNKSPHGEHEAKTVQEQINYPMRNADGTIALNNRLLRSTVSPKHLKMGNTKMDHVIVNSLILSEQRRCCL
ncbi:uncharacterized protein BT62DRAFT_1004102 [Guyanagaster necrorhizus]|uniref:Uncharacterized protein n=1 Tax=Guyanagaster necrorhizus TaxID=856835 RepID=A0A9P8AUQ7_9AGAR|nr:uncharacterized protein BT62DRAFT_1004102 [Guyanagaster necrorhizus MCA 3950]KAG7448311.1 hypothetical protein BT62DRAFT_1004102 [Guyanagaster necrorhizus MCA 3950]